MWRSLHGYLRGIRPQWQWLARTNEHKIDNENNSDCSLHSRQDILFHRDDSHDLELKKHDCDFCNENLSLQSKAEPFKSSVYGAVLNFGEHLSSFWHSFLRNHTIQINGNDNLYSTVYKFLKHENLKLICSKCINNEQNACTNSQPHNDINRKINLTEKVQGFLKNSNCSFCSSSHYLEQDKVNTPIPCDFNVKNKPKSSIDARLMRAGRKFSEATEETIEKTNIYQACQYAHNGEWMKAYHIWKQASDKGCTVAHYNLGICYQKGNGVKIDVFKALSHYQYAASGGHMKATYNLAMLILSHNMSTESTKADPIELLQRAADMGFSHAQRELGVLFTDGKLEDMGKAANLFSKSAAQNDPGSQYYLGICFENGLGVEKNLPEAINLYKKSAANGKHEAEYQLAKCHEFGLGHLEVNLQKALKYYKLSYEGGVKEARSDIMRMENNMKVSNEEVNCRIKNMIPVIPYKVNGKINSFASLPDMAKFQKTLCTSQKLKRSPSIPLSSIRNNMGLGHSEYSKRLNYFIKSHDSKVSNQSCKVTESYINLTKNFNMESDSISSVSCA